MGQTLFDKLLNYYQINETDYQELIKDIDESNFRGNHNFNHINEAVDLINYVISENGRIFIYGDYDTDGIMGTSILVKMLQYVGIECDYYIPSRYLDGYGITLAKAQECIDNKVSLVITVDNGVSAYEPIKLLKNNNIKVLVLDHHTIPEIVPLADVILHPTFDYFGEVASSGAFVAFIFSISFLNRFDKYLSTLASISLISDMMPLKDYNRNLLRLVIKNYKDGEFFTIDALKEGEKFDEVSIGMKIAPKINAVGRIIENDDVNLLVDYFTTDDNEKIIKYISWINEINENRKLLSRDAIESIKDIKDDESAIVISLDIKEGIMGLVANQIMNKYHKPTIVMSLDINKEFYKGSARAIEGFNIVEAFENCKDYLVAYGGHALAGGCTIKKEDFDNFKKSFVKYCDAHPVSHIEPPSIDFALSELTYDNYLLVKSFSPFGENWKAPLFKIKKISTRSLFYSKSGEHILTLIGTNSKLVGFNFSRLEMNKYSYIDILGTMKTSTYREKVTLEFNIKEIEESK